MRIINVLTSIFALILLVGCASGEIIDVPEKYPPRSEKPIMFKNRGEAYVEGYVSIGSIKIKAKSYSAALKRAAKYGAEAVTISPATIYRPGGKIPYYSGSVMLPDATGRVLEPGKEKPAYLVSLFRYDPSRALTEGMISCFITSKYGEKWPCDEHILRKLLSKGADPNLRYKNVTTPLYAIVSSIEATRYGGVSCLKASILVKILVDAGADLNIVPKQRPSLIKLIRTIRKEYDGSYPESCEEIEKLFLSKGAKP
jgi:hypothetical protein